MASPGRMGPELVWYASYGSNMRMTRLAYYLAGGSVPGSDHRHPGCRDPRPPRLAVPIMLPGAMYFATESLLWSGGVAFYDPTVEGQVAGRAYLLTAGQFADVAAQEMHRAPQTDLDLAAVLRDGRAQVGPGRYETLVLVGHRADVPILTFTAPWRRADVPPTKPSAGYLSMLAVGLREAHDWSSARIAAYLASCSGAAGHWTPEEIERLLAVDDADADADALSAT
ncbi:histone deacetylase [Frankia sp. AiPa1]|nr:histone deacetylase [Frankia sp. AiPa1]